jgi:hypothetical protein
MYIVQHITLTCACRMSATIVNQLKQRLISQLKLSTSSEFLINVLLHLKAFKEHSQKQMRAMGHYMYIKEGH